MNAFSHIRITLVSSLLLLTGLIPSMSYGQSTLTFTSLDPLDGPSTWGTYCYANGNLASNYCSSSSIEAFFSKANIIWTFGGQAGTYPYTGGTFVTWVHSGGVTGNVSAANVYFTGNLADVFGITIYHESGSTVNFTLTGYDSGGGVIASTSTSVDHDRATNVSVTGMSSIYRFEIVPSSTINFGLNNLELAEPGTFPVEFLGFEAETHGRNVDLEWKTAWETNNHFFAVERSLDGETFEAIGQVEGAGTSETESSYSFTDFSAPNGTLIYRLKQVDFDGKFNYSSSVEVSISEEPTLAYFDDQADILHFTANDDWTVTLMDLNGKTILSSSASIKEVSLPEIASGIYIVRFESPTNESVSQKISIR